MWRALVPIASTLAACGGATKRTDPPPPDTDPKPEEPPAVSALCQSLDDLSMAVSFVGDVDLEGEELGPTAQGDDAELQQRFEQTVDEITGCLNPELWVETTRTETSRELLQSGLQVGLVVTMDLDYDESYTLRILIINVS